ncbi:MAG TPA: hypothetical protein PKV16_06780 [Caldisericia bacterium]|nr:hypothetical protein [Caldisericia bacterium]HPF49471.1 hypothetical protein [Caldisericia bacterium]HPI84235.1 hypothetical protein [Caldisericia bacterium]HPQ93470.1 hypothetical protein [Caldisericia bacterium]HRV75524.1 hypothetical protein [Caldisericia bacterium]
MFSDKNSRVVSAFVGVFLVVGMFVSCAGSNTEPPQSSIKNLKEITKMGFHSTAPAAQMDELLLIPVDDEIIAVDMCDFSIPWKYAAPPGKNWSCAYITTNESEIVAGFEGKGEELVATISKSGSEKYTSIIENDSSSPVWHLGKWWRMSNNRIYSEDFFFDIPDSFPRLNVACDLFIYYTLENHIEARDSDGKLYWEAKIAGQILSLLDLDWALVVQTKNDALFLDPRTGSSFFSLAISGAVKFVNFGNDFLMGEFNRITCYDREGNRCGTVDTAGIPNSIVTTSDGFVSVMNNQLITFDQQLNPKQVFSLTPGIHEAFIYGDSIAVSGYSQVFYKSDTSENGSEIH